MPGAREPTESSSERRAFPRVANRLPVRYELDGATHDGVTEDLSSAGLYVVTRNGQPAPGKRLVVELDSPLGGTVRLQGRVAADGDGRRRGFGFALEVYNEDYARVLRAATSGGGAPLVDGGLVRVLLVDPSERNDALVREAVSRIEVGNFKVECIGGAREALAELGRRRHDVALVSWRVPPSGGVSLIELAIAQGCEIPLVLLTNVHDRSLEVEAIRGGAAEAIDLAHLDTDTLERTLRSALERTRLEAPRRAAYRELQDLYDRAPCGDLLLDERGVFLRANDTALSWLGYAREELVGKRRFVDVLEPGCVDRFHEQVRWFLEPGRLRGLALELCRKDGRVVPVSASASLVVSEGAPPRSRWTLLDTTDRHEREVAKRRLVRALDTMRLGVVLADLFGSVLYANAALAAMRGGPADLVGTDARLLLPEDLRADVFAPPAGAKQAKRETRLLRADGSELPVHVVSDLVADELGVPFAVLAWFEERAGLDERRPRVSRAAQERLVEQLGRAEETIRSLSDLLLDRLSEEDPR
jgi:PAS domain S-box-containing protein